MINPDDNHGVLDAVLDENGRRYYLDVMGVQCWQLLEPESASLQTPAAIEKDVADDVDKKVQYDVLSRGSESADLMFVILSPSSSDAAEGELCSGEEGALLTKMLAAINISIEDVYLTSLLQYRASADSAISENEMALSNAHLKQQVQKVKPKVLIVLGEAAAHFLLKQKTPLDTLREQISLTGNNTNQSAPTYESIPLFISYSPTELLQKAENKRKAWSDLQQLQTFFQK